MNMHNNDKQKHKDKRYKREDYDHEVEKYKKDKKYGYCDFEIDPYVCELWGYMKAYVYEEDYPEGEHDAKTIIACDEEWYVKVKWRLWGKLHHHLCGSFCVCVYLDPIGPGQPHNLDCDGNGQPCIKYIPMDPCGDGCYEVECKIPAGTVDCGDCGQLYEVAVTLTSFDACYNPGHIAAYCKGPCLMFYEPPHPDKNGNNNGKVVSVSIVDNAFNPPNVPINAGDTVRWTNNGALPHTVTSNPGPAGCAPPSTENFASGTLSTNNTFQHTFNTAGSFAYHCEIHGCSMAGTVTVT